MTQLQKTKVRNLLAEFIYVTETSGEVRILCPSLLAERVRNHFRKAQKNSEGSTKEAVTGFQEIVVTGKKKEARETVKAAVIEYVESSESGENG